jgi:adenylosuccinate lyase
MVAMENVPLWNERDISHSSVERVIIPDSTITLDYMLVKLTDLISKLHVYPDNMLRNIEKTHGLIFSQRVLLALVEEKGLSRENAYELVQRNAMEAWQTGTNFRELLLKDGEITNLFSVAEIDDLFNFNYHLKYVDHIYQRFGL